MVMISAMILRENSQISGFLRTRARTRDLRLPTSRTSSRFQEVRIKKKKEEEEGIGKKRKGGKERRKEKRVIDRVDIEATNTPPSCQLAN